MTPTPPEDWIVPRWPVPRRVRALITTRSGGSSAGPYASMNLGLRVGDDPLRVDANRRLLGAFLPSQPKWLDQVHGTDVVQAQQVSGIVPADASITRGPGCVNVVLVADCLPVLLAHREGGAVGVAHAGWRGLAGGVVENTIKALDVPGKDLVAYLGPAIGPAAFEVGNEVRDAFVAHDRAAHAAFQAHTSGKWLADLFELARQRLKALGITDVHGGGQCTVSNSNLFFSHRRDKVSGRMAALIWIEDERRA